MLQAWKSAIVQHERYSKTSTLMIEVSAEAIVKDHLAELEAKAAEVDAAQGKMLAFMNYAKQMEDKVAELEAKAALWDKLMKKGVDYIDRTLQPAHLDGVVIKNNLEGVGEQEFDRD